MKFRSMVVVFALLFSPLLSSAQPLADRIPDDAIFYVGWRGVDEPGAGYAQSRLKAFLDASGFPQVVNETLPKLLDKMAEKDHNAAMLREMLGKFGPSLWRYPTAIYVGPVDGLNVGQPMPRIALLCKAGSHAAQLKKDITTFLDQVLTGSLVPVTAIEEEGIVAITLGAGIKAAGALTNNTQRLADVIAAQWCADNHLTGLKLARQYPSIGDSEFVCEELGKTYRGKLAIRPTPNPNFRRVDARISDEDGQNILMLSTILGRF